MSDRTIRGQATNHEGINWCSVGGFRDQSRRRVLLRKKSSGCPGEVDNCNITPFLHSSPRLNLDLWVTPFQKREVHQVRGMRKVWLEDAGQSHWVICTFKRWRRLDKE